VITGLTYTVPACAIKSARPLRERPLWNRQ
jgi:hypothetical protein